MRGRSLGAATPPSVRPWAAAVAAKSATIEIVNKLRMLAILMEPRAKLSVQPTNAK
jgi:hypothetical protein